MIPLGCILYFTVQNYFSKQNSNMEEEKEKKSHYFIYHLSMETSCMGPKKKELLFTDRSLPTMVKRGQQRSLISA